MIHTFVLNSQNSLVNIVNTLKQELDLSIRCATIRSHLRFIYKILIVYSYMVYPLYTVNCVDSHCK